MPLFLREELVRSRRASAAHWRSPLPPSAVHSAITTLASPPRCKRGAERRTAAWQKLTCAAVMLAYICLSDATVPASQDGTLYLPLARYFGRLSGALQMRRGLSAIAWTTLSLTSRRLAACVSLEPGHLSRLRVSLGALLKALGFNSIRHKAGCFLVLYRLLAHRGDGDEKRAARRRRSAFCLPGWRPAAACLSPREAVPSL